MITCTETSLYIIMLHYYHSHYVIEPASASAASLGPAAASGALHAWLAYSILYYTIT